MTTQSPSPTQVVNAQGRFDLGSLKAAVRDFNANGQLGRDPLAAAYATRRGSWNLFAIGLRD